MIRGSMFSRRQLLIGSGAVGLTGALGLSACSGGSPSEVASAAPAISQAEIDAAMNKATALTFWTWVPDIQNEVALFEKKYPQIKVEPVDVGSGAHYPKMRAAIQSGKGAPDVSQIEYQYLSSFTLGGNLLDIGPYGGAAIKDLYPDWIWSQVSKGGQVFAVPQDVGPMGWLYRKDLIEKAGIEPPTTWDAYGAAAETYRSANPKSYLSNMAPNGSGELLGFIWQAGGRPFAFDGDKTVTVDLASEPAMRVIKFWQELLAAGLISVDPSFTDTWYQGLGNGKYASWLTAAWGPVQLQGTAKKTSGQWRASPLPQWDAGASVAGNWGGSTSAVLKGSQNPIAAAQLALWLNTSQDSALKMATEQFLFPASNEILKDSTFADQESTFFGGQKVNALFSEISQTVSPDFAWLPFMDFVYSNFTETLGKSIAEKGNLESGLQAWQDAVATYAKDQGFTVA